MTKRPIVLIIRDGWGINPGGREKAEENGDATMLGEHALSRSPLRHLSASDPERQWLWMLASRTGRWATPKLAT